VDLEDPMSKNHVVTVFLRNEMKILILKRSEQVRSYRGKWAGVSGSVEGGSPLMQAMQELQEETGLKGADVRFVKAGREFEVEDDSIGQTWVVHPFLFDALNLDRFELDWEHSEHKWIDPLELELFETVPMLGKSLQRVM
jgi:8-oxo-dGTP pyrophosphatase MutT (NUDIX family)